MAMVEAAPQLAAGRPPVRLTHQTGERDVEMVRTAYRQAGVQGDVEPFLYDMGRQLAGADLIVCRAGATTLAEIMAAGKPAILIPLPTATDDHQRKNAESLVAAAAAHCGGGTRAGEAGCGAGHRRSRAGAGGAQAAVSTREVRGSGFGVLGSLAV